MGTMEQEKHCCAIVLSAGTGSRMQSVVPKQYLELAGNPVLFYSLKAFEDSGVDEIILVAGADYVDYCRSEIVDRYGLHKVKAVVPGGAERYLSVYEGLKRAESEYVLVHDGARPLLSQDVIQKAMTAVTQEGACAVAVPVKDTIKVVDGNGYVTGTPERSGLRAMQTPQCFSRELLITAYQILFEKQKAGETIPAITDDAMVVEYATGHAIKIVEGEYENFKITTPEDLILAERILQRKMHKMMLGDI